MITTPITFWAPGGYRVPAFLAFDPADPLVVRLTLTCGEQVAVWHLSRRLLVDAMVRPAVGIGDVLIRVTRDAWMELWLSSPAGQSVQRCSAPTVWEFLELTFAACPPCRGPGSVAHRFCAECATVDVALDEWLTSVTEARS